MPLRGLSFLLRVMPPVVAIRSIAAGEVDPAPLAAPAESCWRRIQKSQTEAYRREQTSAPPYILACFMMTVLFWLMVNATELFPESTVLTVSVLPLSPKTWYDLLLSLNTLALRVQVSVDWIQLNLPCPILPPTRGRSRSSQTSFCSQVAG